MKLDFTGYEDIPDYTKEALARYVEHKIMPGGFLTAVLSNDLFGAVGRADSSNAQAIPLICQFVYNRMPSNSWGSADKMWDYVAENFYEKI